MGGGVNEVVPSEIHKAASRMHDAVTGVQGNIPTAVDQISAALPNSSSGSAGNALKGQWHSDYSTWVKDASAHVKTMHDAANNWDKVDHTNAARAEKLAREMGDY